MTDDHAACPLAGLRWVIARALLSAVALATVTALAGLVGLHYLP